MRAHDILGYVDLDRITTELLQHLQDVIDREAKRPIDLKVLGLIYGQIESDLKIDQANAVIAKTVAETEKLRATAAMYHAKMKCS